MRTIFVCGCIIATCMLTDNLLIIVGVCIWGFAAIERLNGS